MDNQLDQEAITVNAPRTNFEKSIDKEGQDQYFWGEESHYRALFEQTNDGVFIISLDLKYIAVNSNGARMLGYEIDDLVGMQVHEIIALEERVDEFTNSDDGDNSNLYERYFQRKDGTVFPVEISTSLVYDEDNLPKHIQSIVRDISIRKETEDALIQHGQILSIVSDTAERLLRTTELEKNLSLVISGIGKISRVSYANLFFLQEDKSGIPKVQVLEEWHSLEHKHIEFEDLVEGGAVALFNLRNQGVFIKTEEEGKFIPFKQTVRSFAIVPVIVNEVIWGYFGLFDLDNEHAWYKAERDSLRTAANIIGAAVQRNQNEKEIRLRGERNRAIVEALPDVVLRVDSSGRIIDFNSRTAHPLHIPREEAVGKEISNIWPDQVSIPLMNGIEKCFNEGSVIISDIHFPDVKNTYEVRIDEINSVEVIIILRDISEQARLEQMKSDFINRASHELRTPLTSAILMADLIREGGEPEECDEYWGILISELNRQKILIDRLLMAGRLESGTLGVDPKPIRLIPVIEESISAVKPIADKKSIEIFLDTSIKIPDVYGEKSGLLQVLINLINNAVKFSPDGSVVRIEVVSEKEIVKIIIRDQGIGIPQEDLPHMFERFFRAKNVTIAEIPGSGVGLYIVKSILEELGGSVEVESNPGSGTTFFISLITVED